MAKQKVGCREIEIWSALWARAKVEHVKWEIQKKNDVVSKLLYCILLYFKNCPFVFLTYNCVLRRYTLVLRFFLYFETSKVYFYTSEVYFCCFGSILYYFQSILLHLKKF